MMGNTVIIVLAMLAIIISVWYVLSQIQPKNVVGVVHWKSGCITYTRIFDKFSDFEEYFESMIETHGDKILKITWIYADNYPSKE